MKYNEAKKNATIFGSNARAEDGFRGYRPEYSMQQAVLVPLGTIAAIFFSCLVVSLTRC